MIMQDDSKVKLNNYNTDTPVVCENEAINMTKRSNIAYNWHTKKKKNKPWVWLFKLILHAYALRMLQPTWQQSETSLIYYSLWRHPFVFLNFFFFFSGLTQAHKEQSAVSWLAIKNAPLSRVNLADTYHISRVKLTPDQQEANDTVLPVVVMMKMMLWGYSGSRRLKNKTSIEVKAEASGPIRRRDPGWESSCSRLLSVQRHRVSSTLISSRLELERRATDKGSREITNNHIEE